MGYTHVFDTLHQGLSRTYRPNATFFYSTNPKSCLSLPEAGRGTEDIECLDKVWRKA